MHNHVWPTALAFYQLLTRCGLDTHAASTYVVNLCILPRVLQFRKTPQKMRRRLGGFAIHV